MRVAMVGQKGIPARIGGVERYVEQLARRLHEYGIQTVVYNRRWFVEGVPPVDAPGVTCRTLPSIPTKHLDTISHVLACVADIAARRDVDLVHVHCIGPALALPLLRCLRIPVIVSVQGLDWRRDKWGRVARTVLKAGEWIACRLADRLVVVSPALAAYYRDTYGIDPVYVPNAAEPFPYRPPKQIRKWGLEEGRYVLYVGRLVPEKGLHFLVRAFRRVAAPWKLVIAGGSMYETQYEAQLRQAADNRVVFTGTVGPDSLAELYHHAGLFVLPSLVEGMSLALLEALHHGLPCLVSDIPENRAVIEIPEGLFRAGDEDALAERLAELTTDNSQRNTLAAYCAARAAQFSWDEVARRMATLYYEVTRESSPAYQRSGSIVSPRTQSLQSLGLKPATVPSGTSVAVATQPPGKSQPDPAAPVSATTG